PRRSVVGGGRGAPRQLAEGDALPEPAPRSSPRVAEPRGPPRDGVAGLDPAEPRHARHGGGRRRVGRGLRPGAEARDARGRLRRRPDSRRAGEARGAPGPPPRRAEMARRLSRAPDGRTRRRAPRGPKPGPRDRDRADVAGLAAPDADRAAIVAGGI